MHGHDSFAQEYAHAIPINLGSVTVPVLPLARIIVSKQATGQPKDKAILPVLHDALKTLRALEE